LPGIRVSNTRPEILISLFCGETFNWLATEGGAEATALQTLRECCASVNLANRLECGAFTATFGGVANFPSITKRLDEPSVARLGVPLDFLRYFVSFCNQLSCLMQFLPDATREWLQADLWK
jgi:hypothetical protein